MRSASVILLTDRQDRSRALADAVRSVSACRIVGLGEPLFCFEPVVGVIADIDLNRPEAKHIMTTLIDVRQEPRVPVIVLLRTSGDAALRRATQLGATACFSELTDAGTIVAALFQQIDPRKTMVDRLVEHSVARTGMLLADMLATAQAGSIDPDGIERGIDPVVDAMRDGGLRRWLEVIAAHDDFTLRHCLLVAGLAAHLALYLGFSASDRATLVRAGLVHDVGKASIPLSILNKPGPLDPDEKTMMRTHPSAGHAILLASGMSDPTTLAATRHHHEMLDGSGYPDGLTGEQIGDAVRLLTICDIGAALIEQRPYRLPMSQSDALAVLRKMGRHGLDAALVEAFADSVAGADLLPAVESKIAPRMRRELGIDGGFGRGIKVTLPNMREARLTG